MDESERYRAAWQARRRRLWIQVAVFLAFLVGLHASHDLWTDAVCIVGMLAVVRWFFRFRCPRCGEIFFDQWYKYFGRRRTDLGRCQHCRLALNEIPGQPSA